jgi:hypothetical protein
VKCGTLTPSLLAFSLLTVLPSTLLTLLPSHFLTFMSSYLPTVSKRSGLTSQSNAVFPSSPLTSAWRPVDPLVLSSDSAQREGAILSTVRVKVSGIGHDKTVVGRDSHRSPIHLICILWYKDRIAYATIGFPEGTSLDGLPGAGQYFGLYPVSV